MELGEEDELPQQLGRAGAAQRLFLGSLHCTGAIKDQGMVSSSITQVSDNSLRARPGPLQWTEYLISHNALRVAEAA